MKKVKKIGILVLAFLVLGGLALSIFTGKEVFDGFTNTIPREETLKYAETYKGAFQKFAQGKDLEKLAIPSRQGDHTIPGILIKKPGNQNMAVLVHGLGGTKTSLARIMDIFLDMGYNVLAIDQRNSGDNQAPYNTFGVLESLDILDAVDAGKKEMEEVGRLILWGESYGGASAAMAAGRDDSKIDALILESPVADFNEMLDGELIKIEKSQGIPAAFMRWTGDLYTRYKLHFSLEDINACKWIQKASVPVLITNGDQDKVTPPHMGEDLYKAISHDKKQIYTAKDFGHTEFPKEEGEAYQKLVENFLKTYL